MGRFVSSQSRTRPFIHWSRITFRCNNLEDLTRPRVGHNRFGSMQEPDDVYSSLGLLKRHTHSGLLRVSGKDHARWLQGIVTADLVHIPDRAFWGLMLQRNGKVRSEVIGIASTSELWLAVVGGELGDVLNYLDSLIVMEDVEVGIDSQMSLWAIHNPGAPGSSIGAANVSGEGSLEWIGERDRVFLVSASEQTDWLARLREAGLEPCDDGAWESLRVSAGLPKWSVDFSSQDTPHHAGLFGRAVATNKGCYIGQEVVCKVEMIGHVKQRLTRLKLDTLTDVFVGADVQDDQTGESAGVITSVAGGPSEQSGWAIARVKSALIDKGSRIRVGQSQGRIVDMLRG